jgi:hypothetical protein
LQQWKKAWLLSHAFFFILANQGEIAFRVKLLSAVDLTAQGA